MSKSKETSEPGADTQENKKTCFVMMPFSDPAGYDLGHFGRVFKHIIDPAIKQAGFEPIISNQLKSSHVIMIDVLKHLLNADMSVCDISSRNPNVLYELGIRQAFDMPVALLKDESTEELFDTFGIRYSPYSRQLRVDRIEEEVNQLAESITETYEKRNTEVFSLVQLLGRDKAIIKPSTISDDVKIILDAIDGLRSKPSVESNLTTSNYASGKTLVYKQTFFVQKDNIILNLNALLSTIRTIMPHNRVEIDNTAGTQTPGGVAVAIYSIKRISDDEGGQVCSLLEINGYGTSQVYI